MKNCAVIAMTPTQVISSICALKALNKENDINVTFLFHNPSYYSENDEAFQESARVVSTLISGFNFVKKFKALPYSAELQMLSVDTLEEAIANLKLYIENERIDEIYYPHDVIGELYQFLCMSFPEAQRICLGDALGYAIGKKTRLDLVRQDLKLKEKISITYLQSIVFQKIGMLIFHLFPSGIGRYGKKQLKEALYEKEFKPDKAVLILPMDQSGTFLKNLPLTVCDKDIVRDVLRRLSSNCEHLNSYMDYLLSHYKNKERYLFLTEVYSEASYLEFETDIRMNCSIIESNCKAGSVIFIKGHPTEKHPRAGRIKELLSDKYDIVEIDGKYRRYSVELMDDLVLGCNVISSSYAVLSLKYLYDKDVIQPMDKVFIEKWFPESFWRTMNNSLEFCTGTIDRLYIWDGKSVIWSGGK